MEQVLSQIFTEEGAPRHHAFLLRGTPALASEAAAALIAKGLAPVDVIAYSLDKVLATEARAWRAQAGAPFSSSCRCQVIGFNELQVEAEQALLKILEEPPAQNIFLLITPRPEALSATVLSRLWRLGGLTPVAEVAWLDLPTPRERLEAAEQAAAKIEEDDESKRAYAWAVLAAAETRLVALARAGRSASEAVAAVSLLRQVLTSGPRLSLKNLLAHLALVWPGR